MNLLNKMLSLTLTAAMLAAPANAAMRAPQAPAPEDQAKPHDMTPEQREAYHEKRFNERIANLSPEKQAQARERYARHKQKREEHRARIAAMTPEQREAFKAQHPHHGRGHGHGHGRHRPSPEERAKIRAMTPEQRQAFFQQRFNERIANLPPEQQAEARARFAKKQAHRAEMKAKWDAMTPEQRAAAKAEHHGRGRWGHHGGRGHHHDADNGNATFQAPSDPALAAAREAEWSKLSPEERKQAEAQRDGWISKLSRDAGKQ